MEELLPLTELSRRTNSIPNVLLPKITIKIANSTIGIMNQSEAYLSIANIEMNIAKIEKTVIRRYNKKYIQYQPLDFTIVAILQRFNSFSSAKRI